MNNAWKEMYGSHNSDEFIRGVKAGIRMFAHWEDGAQYCGTTGTTLKKALADAEEGLK